MSSGSASQCFNIHLFADCLEIEGNGREKSRRIPLRQVQAGSKGHRLKVLRNAAHLPVPFRGDSGGGDSVRRRVTRVTGNMCGRCSMTRRTGRSSRTSGVRIASRSMGSKRRCPRRAHPHQASHPCATRFERHAGTMIVRMRLLEKREDVLGTVRSPEYKRLMVLCVEIFHFRKCGEKTNVNLLERA